MRITPFAVLEEHARKEYAKRFASVPEPRILNARALVSFSAPRGMNWGGVGYWVPPLSYEDGNRMLAAASYIRDALRQQKHAAAQSAAQVAVRLLHAILPRPSLRRPRQWVRSFIVGRDDTPEAIEGMLRWLLTVEDESLFVPSDQRVTIDLVDNRAAFAHELPAWSHSFGSALWATLRDRRPHNPGDPLSWKHYVYGMKHIGRQAAREDLRGAVAVRVGVNAEKKGWQDYERELRSLAGW